MVNFTEADVCGILRAIPFFGLVFLSPGYCLGRVSNLFGFRERSGAEQWLWSMGLSLVTVPITLNLLGRWAPIRISVAFCWIIAAVAAVDLLLRWARKGFPMRVRPERWTIAALFLAALWVLVCLFSLPDLQIGDRLYPSAAIPDLGVRAAFVASSMLGGAPPANPFFYPEHFVGLRYFYYWYVVAAIPGLAARVEARAALFASCVWSGWLLAAVLALFLKYFCAIRRNLRKTSVIAMGLLGVTGLDVLFVGGLYLHDHIVLANTEMWDSDEVASWPKSLLWDPHHVAATSACMLSLALLWHAGRREHSGGQRLLMAVLAAFGFASAGGMSVYVAVAFALFLFALGLYWVATRRFRLVGLSLAVGALVVLLSVGYLHDLRATGASDGEVVSAQSQPSSHFAKIALRQLPPVWAPAVQRAVHHNKLANILVRPFILVPVLFIEFGFFFLVAIRQGMHDWHQRKRYKGTELAAQDYRDMRNITWLLLAAGLWVAVMMQSTVINNNDLAYRGVELAQFVLLLWGAAQLAGTRSELELPGQTLTPPAASLPSPVGPRVGWLAGSLLLVGLVSSTYQAIILRFYFPGADRYGWMNAQAPHSVVNGRFGAADYQIRSAYAALDRILPATAKVQFGAAPRLDIVLMYYSRYQELDGIFPGCGTVFGGSEASCARITQRIGPLFGTSALPPIPGRPDWKTISVETLHTPGEVRSLCRDLGIDALIVTREDPVWSDPEAWPHRMKPVVAGDFAAAYDCR